MSDREITLETDRSLSQSFVGAYCALNSMPYFAVQAIWTGSPVGTLYLQTSSNLTNWDDIEGSEWPITVAGSHTWNFTGAGFRYMRLSYNSDSGSGTLTAHLSRRR